MIFFFFGCRSAVPVCVCVELGAVCLRAGASDSVSFRDNAEEECRRKFIVQWILEQGKSDVDLLDSFVPVSL